MIVVRVRFLLGESLVGLLRCIAMMHFELYKGRGEEWRWRLRAANGNIVADSGESYTTKASAEAGIASVKRGAADAPVREA